MRLEANSERFQILRSRTVDDFFQYGSVGAMHAIEVADAHDRGPEVRGYVREFVEDLRQISKSSFMPS